jgi:hypothetical protein
MDMVTTSCTCTSGAEELGRDAHGIQARGKPSRHAVHSSRVALGEAVELHQEPALGHSHVFGLHHQVRPEDFPVQPCIFTGFKLMPSGFFGGNPGIDLAPDKNNASCHAQAAEQ